MSDEWDGFCAVCASRDYRGDLHITENAPGDAGQHGDLQRVRLCTPCFAFVAESLVAAVERPAGEPGDLHVPERWANTMAPDGCEVCHRAVRHAIVVNLDAADGPRSPGPLLRLAVRPRAHRLCDDCLGWFRDVLDQESASRWGNRRRESDPRGGAPVDARYRVRYHALREHDQKLLREAVEQLGYAFEGEAREPAFAQDDAVYFVAAGPAGLAAAFTEALPVTERVRVIVVSASDHLEDASEALRLGAADLLAEPLSRQQIVGAFDRLADPFAVSGRDEATGLPTYWMRPRFGLPCHLVEVTPPEDENSLEVFLVLRRFLRGYDRVGIGDDGSLPAILYCSDEYIEGVVRRMRRLLGAGHDVLVLGRAGGEDNVPRDDPAAHRRPVLAAAFFGRALGRRAS